MGLILSTHSIHHLDLIQGFLPLVLEGWAVLGTPLALETPLVLTHLEWEVSECTTLLCLIHLVMVGLILTLTRFTLPMIILSTGRDTDIALLDLMDSTMDSTMVLVMGIFLQNHRRLVYNRLQMQTNTIAQIEQVMEAEAIQGHRIPTMVGL